jgi:sulfur dioxygenase
MLIRQLFDHDTFTYTYVIADEAARVAALVDPVLGQVERDLALLDQLGLKLSHVLDTHVHADHVTGAGILRERTGARVVASPLGAECADTKVSEGDAIEIGALRIKVLATPGHTDDSLSFVVGNNVFTGDALLVRGTGRTDFQNGSADVLWSSITEKLFALPDDTVVWPAHDYRGHAQSTIGEEKRHNPRLAGKSKSEFLAIMAALNLPRPRYLELAVPANKECGLGSPPSEIAELPFRELGVEDAMAFVKQETALVLDVREPHELSGELGQIPGALNVPSGEISQVALDLPFVAPVLVVCRSGRRSRAVCEILTKRGFRNVVNLAGGMLEYRQKVAS